MAREVNLYINVNLKSEFVYKLIMQLYSKSIKLIIVLNTYEQVAKMDFDLWNNILDSFLAHMIWKENQVFPFNSPIVLTIFNNLENFDKDYTIINLTDEYIINKKVKKIVEIFENNQKDLVKARESYAFYKANDFVVKYFDLIK